MTKPIYYITTAIDYSNSDPHIGHAFEKIIADTAARWKRVLGYDVFFLTGTDENGQKLKEAAENAGFTPQEFVDKQVLKFKDFAKKLNISNDSFIRTTSPKHKKVAKAIFEKVFKKGDIYKGKYKGHYCVACERYYTEKDLEDGNCPYHKKKTKILEEESYFFKMGNYEKQLLEHIKKNKDFILPETRRNEILSRLKEPLRDLSVSRSSFDWGIQLPNDKSHIIYVWFDALLNYISGIDYPNKQFKKYWPHAINVIGKDILWFHAVIWPCILLAAGITPPKQVYAHGFINDKNGEKMSKSRGNVVDPLEMVNKYGSDIVKYYFLRTTPSGNDGNFSEKELVERYNKELADELGNLVSRVTAFVEKNFNGKIPKATPEKLFKENVYKEIDNHINYFEFNLALDKILHLIKLVNKYINDKEPWKVKDKKKLAKIVYTSADAVRLINILIQAFLPNASEEINKLLGFKQETIKEFKWGLTKENKVKRDILFPKIEFKEQTMFPLKLRVGKVLEVKDHPEADKLYILKVKLDKTIQLVAGIKEFYKKEELKNKIIVVVTNLKPAKLRGIESQGMLLTGENKNQVELLTSELKPGTEIKVKNLKNNSKLIDFKEFCKLKLELKDKKVFCNNIEIPNIKTEKLKQGTVR